MISSNYEEIRNSKFAIRNSQSNVFKLKRLAFNASRRRRDPVGDLARLSHRMHQAAHVFAIFHRRQPFRLAPLKLFRSDQVSLDVEMMAGVFPNMAMKMCATSNFLSFLLPTFFRPLPGRIAAKQRVNNGAAALRTHAQLAEAAAGRAR